MNKDQQAAMEAAKVLAANPDMNHVVVWVTSTGMRSVSYVGMTYALETVERAKLSEYQVYMFSR